MTIPAFAFLFTLITTAELRAESWNCGPEQNGEYSNSVICTYDEQSKTLIIEGEGNMGNYNSMSDSTPWTSKEILHAVIKGNVTSIGDRVFKSIHSLQDISGAENITSIGIASFLETSLTSADFPKVTKVKRSAFNSANNLEYITFSKGVIFYDYNATYPTFGGTKIPDCADNGNCGVCEWYIMRGFGCVSDCGEGYLGKDGLCIDSAYGCGAEYRQFENFCNRIRYTPAEAAQVLREGNNNEIVITFKK
jgi:hypothetical protein